MTTPHGHLFVSFNTEGGCREGFLDYITSLGKNQQIAAICFQEVRQTTDNRAPETLVPRFTSKPDDTLPVRLNLYRELEQALGEDSSGIFSPQLLGLHDYCPCEFEVQYGQATFVRTSLPGLKHLGSEGRIVYRTFGDHNKEAEGGKPSAKSMITTALSIHGSRIVVGNVHGFWSRRGKIDMPERLLQNDGIAAGLTRYRDQHDCHDGILLLGDLNYHSGMEALEHLRQQPVFGQGGMILNHRFGITDTRTRYYNPTKPCREADFATACGRLSPRVVDAWVDLDVPSDHAAMFVLLGL